MYLHQEITRMMQQEQEIMLEEDLASWSSVDSIGSRKYQHGEDSRYN